MMRKIIPVIYLLMLAGCQSVTNSSPPDAGVPRIDTSGMPTGCLRVNEIDEWRVLTEVNILVYAPTRSRPFLLTISPPARFASKNIGMGFTGDMGRICGRVGDNVVIREGVLREFAIIDVRELTDEQGKQLVSEAETGTLRLIETERAAESATSMPDGGSNSTGTN